VLTGPGLDTPSTWTREVSSDGRFGVDATIYVAGTCDWTVTVTASDGGQQTATNQAHVVNRSSQQ